jgi:hypothetical protein
MPIDKAMSGSTIREESETTPKVERARVALWARVKTPVWISSVLGSRPPRKRARTKRM